MLSPCVLPLLPIVFGAAAGRHRFGPVALAAGTTLSFTAIGLFVATVGFALGIEADVFRIVAALIAMALGLVLVAPPLQARLAYAAGPIGDRLDRRFGAAVGTGPWASSGWGCCSGPCGAPAWVRRSGPPRCWPRRGRDLGQVALTMGCFGLGAALPLLALGALSREAMLRWRGALLGAGAGLKVAFGAILILTGVAVVTGLDRSAETALVEASPAWLTTVTTRF